MRIGKALLYTILVLYAIVTMIPFLWALSSSFKTLEEIVSGSIRFIPEILRLITINKFLSNKSYFLVGL